MSCSFESVDVFIGERISKARQDAGLTIEALADRLGLSVLQVNCLECGTARASARTLSHLARTLGIEIHSFFNNCRQMQYQPADQIIETAKTRPALAHVTASVTAQTAEPRAA